MNSPGKGTYIAGIDGLRAISVLAVILFHYVSGFESAGYLGVDVFFVISGFVITASIANYETPESLKDFTTRFYLRRLKRLLPAVFVVVVFTSIMIMLVTTGGRDNIRTGALALVGGANIFLYIKEADYFALTSELNPFTHMWSLAVEDQFYLLFPFLLWWGAYFKTQNIEDNFSRLLKILGAICLASLVGFVIAFEVDYSFAFYMMPTRLWEIGLGIMTYLLVSRTNALDFLKSIPTPVFISALLVILVFGHLAPLAAHIGVALVTSATLASFWHHQDKKSILSKALPVYIGKISYSLYLWHWPFIVLAKHTVGISLVNVLVCLVLTVVFAIASYHLIEQPFRHYKRHKTGVEREKQYKIIVTSIITSTLVLYVGLSRYAPEESNLLAQSLGIANVAAPFPHHCHGIDALKKYTNPLEACLGEPRTEEKPKRLFLLGDSNANQYVGIIESRIENSEYKLQFINAESQTQGVSGLMNRANFVPPDFGYMLETVKAGDLFVLSFHKGRLNAKRDEHVSLDAKVELNTRTKNFISNLKPILMKLNEKGVSVLLIKGSPLMAHVMTMHSCAIQTRFSGDNLCKVSREQVDHTRTRQIMAYDALKNAVPDIHFWDPMDTIFNGQSHFDIMDNDGDFLMYDWSHITPKLAMRLQPDFEKTLDDILSGTR